MNEIKVGDYVRTEKGQIYKIEDGTEFYEDSVNVGIGIIPDVDGIWVDKEHFNYVDKRDIVKHSPNIIDLIEVGDYVNGKKIESIIEGNWKSEGVAETILCFEIDFPIEKGLRAYHNCDIKSIVTKEQFAQMEYKVEE